MHKLTLALVLSAAIALPVAAQKKEEPKKEAPKAALPGNVLLKTQAATQYLARGELIGAKVADKDGQTIGTIDDLIIGPGERIEGVLVGVGGFLGVGEKKVGVALRALKLTRADGKLTVSIPGVTREMVDGADAFVRSGASKK